MGDTNKDPKDAKPPKGQPPVDASQKRRPDDPTAPQTEAQAAPDTAPRRPRGSSASE